MTSRNVKMSLIPKDHELFNILILKTQCMNGSYSTEIVRNLQVTSLQQTDLELFSTLAVLLLIKNLSKRVLSIYHCSIVDLFYYFIILLYSIKYTNIHVNSILLVLPKCSFLSKCRH